MIKKYIILCVSLVFVLSSLAQNESYNKPFNIKRKPGIMRFYTLFAPTENSPERFDRFNTEFYYNNWTGDLNGVETKYYSIGHSLNFMFDLPFSKTSILGIGIGLGYSHFRIRHDGMFNLSETSSILNIDPSADDWYNKTAVNFIEIPFEFRIRSRTERPKFKIYPGFKVGYLSRISHKWKAYDEKIKITNFTSTRPLHYGPSLRLGLNNIMLYGYYDLATIFKDQDSNKLQVFSVGISIGWF